eukprot:TRINITY_DN1678_c0_g2_i1.p2 TRINITY_DN1678_c0_g2~~TRINITY_DN1678_c0_g2_i1.p2  ORF type:complete len:157 (-),score=25.21 TRINITY_DN1678_c0_g2_i1:44-514(-)
MMKATVSVLTKWSETSSSGYPIVEYGEPSVGDGVVDTGAEVCTFPTVSFKPGDLKSAVEDAGTLVRTLVFEAEDDLPAQFLYSGMARVTLHYCENDSEDFTTKALFQDPEIRQNVGHGDVWLLGRKGLLDKLNITFVGSQGPGWNDYPPASIVVHK